MSETKAVTGTAGEPRTESKTGRTRKSTSRKSDAGGTTMWPDMMALAESNMAAMTRCNEAVLSGIAGLNKEMLSFTDASVRDYFACTESMAGCDSWVDAMGKQTEFARAATKQYLDEAAKLLEMSTSLAREGWAPWQESAERAFARRAK